MITIQKQRVLLVLAAAGAIILAAAAAGVAGDKDTEKTTDKKTKSRRGGHPTYLYADSAFVPAEANRVPLVALANTTTSADAIDLFSRILGEELRSKPRYAVMDPARVKAEAAKAGVKDDHQALVRQWDQNRTLVPETVRQFATALKASLVMAGEISEWQSEQVEWNVEGYSHSDVEVNLKLYSGATGALVWEARDKVQLKSAPHDPSASSGQVDDFNIQRGRGQVVPPPPPIDDAAEQVAENLVKALP
jgi:hypothetical protein